ncbi:glycosyltransferase family 4 protein [Crossiella cryophila]|uniref:Glycosyltransferase involved in cell wall biosynthesis n=1 Tax=Crossiella cryophila TaxID=43355 RepID=A0A7W7C4Z7_9PSEU|nr:glycosyltransferase family 4 protein [Crossiella cryophila]MBB4674609.1 glycosyltransferase involved in cell wall biosynthesis [Crossiella cryophila]
MTRPLRIALLSYRGAPHSGGQGVYVRQLSRELHALGHTVEVFAGPPYPDLDPGIPLTRLSTLDIFGEPDPFRLPPLHRVRGLADWVEYLDFRYRGNYPEPLSFSLRALPELSARRAQFDLVHDNQGLGYGLLGLRWLGLPLVATVHHPVAIDRDFKLAATTGADRLGAQRWHRFLGMQGRVARQATSVLTVSAAARAAIVRRMRVPAERVSVVPLGVDHSVFRPGTGPRVPGRIVVTASADVPIKGLRTLLAAVALVRRRMPAELVVVGRPKADSPAAALLAHPDLAGAVRFQPDLTTGQLAGLLRSAAVVCVPSLFEGFSLPAAEAMACGTPLVTTTAGALPEVVGRDEQAGLLVPPADPDALAAALCRVLADPELRARLGAGGVRRAAALTWRRTALATVEQYQRVLPDSACHRSALADH